MSDGEGKENDVNATALRSELKSWENAFKAEHGRKPGRADIKSDAMIGLFFGLGGLKLILTCSSSGEI